MSVLCRAKHRRPKGAGHQVSEEDFTESKGPGRRIPNLQDFPNQNFLNRDLQTKKFLEIYRENFKKSQKLIATSKTFSHLYKMATICLKLSDLEPEFQAKSYEEQVMIANIGAVCFRSLGDVMREQLHKETLFEDKVKMETLRASIEKEVFDSLQKANKELLESRMRCDILEKQIELIKNHTEEEKEKEIKYRVSSETAELRLMLAKTSNTDKLLEYAQEKINILEDKLQKLTSTKSSHELGRIGEALVYNMLKNIVGNEVIQRSSVDDVTKIGHSADFHVSLAMPTGKKIKILVDAKNYSHVVGLSQITKLYADVDSDKDANGGVMVSILSEISKTPSFHIGRSPNQKPVLFLSFQNVTDSVREDMLRWALRTIAVISSEKRLDEQMALIDRTEGFLSNMEKHMLSFDTAIKSHKKVSDELTETYNSIIKEILLYRGGEDVPVENKCEAIKKDGLRCYKTTKGGPLCGSHSKNKKTSDPPETSE